MFLRQAMAFAGFYFINCVKGIEAKRGKEYNNITERVTFYGLYVTDNILRKKVHRMNFLGDYFAFALVGILSLFFFDGKHRLNRASRFFLAALGLTAATAVTDIYTGRLMEMSDVPLWLNMSVNTMFFLLNILTTSAIALYLFMKILEHSHNKHCMKNAVIGLSVCLGLFSIFLIGNLWTGWLFFFDEAGVYCRGPFNAVGYLIVVAQMALVVICYCRNRKNANIIMRRVLIQTFPVVVVWFVIQRTYPEIMMNSFMMSMMNVVLFLTFNGQRPGVNSLTRLNDRHRFFDVLEEGIKNHEPMQVFLVNIKNFGVINQKFGHVFGDEMLYQFAFALEKLITGSQAFHMNGTVFALTIPYNNGYAAQKHLIDLQNFLDSGMECSGEDVSLEYVAVEYRAEPQNINAAELYEMLEYAASWAYQHKLRYICCSSELRREMLRRRYLIERMQVVDREHGFETWYQPILSLASQKFCSMEALVRLVEPDGTIVSPGEFIPVAEQTGMVNSITWFVLEEACRMLHDHPELGEVSVGVNLPMAQLLESGILERINSIVDGYGIKRKRICFEFTERAILENFEQVKMMMAQFTAEGYCFFLDDFGAGYSNFNCLLQLPFQIIKLDMHLIRMDIDGSGEQKLGLIKTLSGFLKGINLVVIAEGVETLEAAQTITEMGIDRIQGYVYAKPMPEKKLLEFYKGK